MLGIDGANEKRTIAFRADLSAEIGRRKQSAASNVSKRDVRARAGHANTLPANGERRRPRGTNNGNRNRVRLW